MSLMVCLIGGPVHNTRVEIAAPVTVIHVPTMRQRTSWNPADPGALVDTAVTLYTQSVKALRFFSTQPVDMIYLAPNVKVRAKLILLPPECEPSEVLAALRGADIVDGWPPLSPTVETRGVLGCDGVLDGVQVIDPFEGDPVPVLRVEWLVEVGD